MQHVNYDIFKKLRKSKLRCWKNAKRKGAWGMSKWGQTDSCQAVVNLLLSTQAPHLRIWWLCNTQMQKFAIPQISPPVAKKETQSVQNYLQRLYIFKHHYITVLLKTSFAWECYGLTPLASYCCAHSRFNASSLVRIRRRLVVRNWSAYWFTDLSSPLAWSSRIIFSHCLGNGSRICCTYCTSVKMTLSELNEKKQTTAARGTTAAAANVGADAGAGAGTGRLRQARSHTWAVTGKCTLFSHSCGCCRWRRKKRKQWNSVCYKSFFSCSPNSKG